MNSPRILLITIPDIELEFQLALYNLKGYLLQHNKNLNAENVGISVFKAPKHLRVQDAFYPYFDKKKLNEIIQKVMEYEPQILGFSCYVWNVTQTLRLIKLIKRKLPKVKIVVGGPEASYYAKKLLEDHKEIDFIVIDEGEEPFLELVNNILYKKDDFKKINGIVFRNKKEIVETPYPKPLDLNTVDSPFLQRLVDIKKEKKITLETSRGCPFKCAYCSYNIRNYAKTRYFSLDAVKQELEYILSNDVADLGILDDTFNLYEKRSIEILKTILKFRKHTKVSFFVRADTWLLSDAIVALFAKTMAHLNIGVQSLNAKTLKISKRYSTRSILEKNLKKFDEAGVSYELQFIMGLPGDTLSDIKTHMNWALTFGARDIIFQILRVTPETHFQRYAKEYGIKYSQKPPYRIYKTSNMTKSDLDRAYLLYATLNFFHNKYRLMPLIDSLKKSLGLDYTDIFEAWIDWNEVSKLDNSTMKKLLSNFIDFICMKYRKVHYRKPLYQILRSEVIPT